MPALNDTQPNKPVQPDAEQQSGPGCLAWGLLGTAATAFSLIAMVVAGLAGYITGGQQVQAEAAEQRAATIDAYLLDVPTRVAEGNTAYIEGYIDWFEQLTPAPDEVSMLQATGTQLALDTRPTATAQPTQTLPPTATTAAPTAAPSATPTVASAPNEDDLDTNVFDPGALFREAEAQIANGELDEAADTLDAVMAIDPEYRPDDVRDLMFTALERQARQLLRSGDPANLSVGIVKANQAEEYGDIGELGYERYIAGLYLNAQSLEGTNPQGAITAYGEIYNQLPSYLDVQQRIFNLRVQLGDEAYDRFDFCPAVVQYQAALQVMTSPDVQSRLETAQESCSANGTPAPGAGGGSTGGGAVGGADTTGEGEQAAPSATPAGVAPIGERN